MDKAADLSLWIGRPTSTALSAMRDPSQRDSPAADSDVSSHQQTPAPSERSSEAEDVTYDGSAAQTFKNAHDNTRSDSEDINEVLPRLQHGFYIDIPPMDEDAKQEYEYLPGHFSASEVISEIKGGRYVVRLHSGEKQSVGRSSLLLVRLSSLFELTWPVNLFNPTFISEVIASFFIHTATYTAACI